MKVSIIGGGGRVGSNAAFALQCAGIVSEIHLLDAHEQLAQGEALDLMHGTSVAGGQKIYAGGYDRAADADLVCITAGLRRKPDESRLDLINRNVVLFKQILESLLSAKLRRDAIVFIVSNPVDVLTRLAIDHMKWDPKLTLGLGTQLDTARFRSLIAAELEVPAAQINALILGEHGDSMTPIWSSAAVGGVPLVKYPGCTPAFQQRIFERTKTSGAEAIKLKGGAGWAVGLTIAQVIGVMALNRPTILPVSTQLSGEYGLEGVCTSVPTLLDRRGVVRRVEIELWPREAAAITAGAKSLEATYRKVQGG
jgi:L-lactate dehydrogenase